MKFSLSKALNPSLYRTRFTILSHSLSTHFSSISTPDQTMTSESTQSQCLFQLKVDPLTGNSEWIVIKEDEEDNSEAVQNHQNALLATTSYLDMLNDSWRNKAYREAIDKAVTKPCNVIDIGAGTGLLSMMAARAMGSKDVGALPRDRKMVTACESYLPMVKLMRKVLHINGMSRDIHIINKRSDEVKVGEDMPSRADVLVSEILDSELLGEGLIPTLQHAHDMLLVENPLTVPYKATTYGQLVESAFLWKLHDLYNNEANASDGIHLVPTGSETILRAKSQQHPLHCNAISKEIKLMSEPFKIFEFDFWKRPESRRETELHVKANSNGTVHAIISWWVLQMDRDGTIFYSTAPRWIDPPADTRGSGNWCDHWKQCVWFNPGKGKPISKGEEVLLYAAHNDTSVFYSLRTQAADARPCGSGIRDFHLTLSPERIAIYGDSKWRSSMITALESSLRTRVQPLCVVADDSIFLTLLVAQLSKDSNVISLFPGLRDQGAQYIQMVARANGVSVDSVQVLRKKKHITLDDTNQRKVDLLISEPFYYGNDGALPWQNLRFWNQRTGLDSILSNDAVIMPCKGILKVMAMSLPDLWSSRCSLSQIEGFDHSVVNSTLGACGELPTGQESPLLPYFIWQCGEVKALSDVQTLMEFDFSKPMSLCREKLQIEYTEAGICHGFVLWIDWVMDMDSNVVVSTGPDQRYWKQGVKLLSEPITMGTCGSAANTLSSSVIEASFDPSTGELVIKHSFA